jgi:SH3-like domain-containing protein
VSLRATNGRRSAALVFMDAGFPVKVLAASGRQYRVILPDGRSGYVAAAGLESAETPLESQWALSPQPVSESPLQEGGDLDLIEAGEEFFVLGKAAGGWLVQTRSGWTGWIPAPSAPPGVPAGSSSSKD